MNPMVFHLLVLPMVLASLVLGKHLAAVVDCVPDPVTVDPVTGDPVTVDAG